MDRPLFSIGIRPYVQKRKMQRALFPCSLENPKYRLYGEKSRYKEEGIKELYRTLNLYGIRAMSTDVDSTLIQHRNNGVSKTHQKQTTLNQCSDFLQKSRYMEGYKDVHPIKFTIESRLFEKMSNLKTMVFVFLKSRYMEEGMKRIYKSGILYRKNTIQ